MSTELTLYGYWRSSAAYRVRIALNLKGLAYRQVPVHLVKDGGQQHAAEYQALNPQGLVPLLEAVAKLRTEREVRLTVAGQQLKFSARSDVPLLAGTPVYVVEALSDTAVEVVSTATDALPGSESP